MKTILAFFAFAISTASLNIEATPKRVLHPSRIHILALNTGYFGGNSLIVLEGATPIVIVGNTKVYRPRLETKTAEPQFRGIDSAYKFQTVQNLADTFSARIEEAAHEHKLILVDPDSRTEDTLVRICDETCNGAQL